MKIHKQLAEGLYILEKTTLEDSRGFFQRLFCPLELKEFWGDREIIQINRSFTKEKGTFRGFHFQRQPGAEMKIIQCVSGKVLDYAIDLREGSKTFMNIFSYELSSQNNRVVIIPEGFAHGFQALEDESELIYIHSAPYIRELEDGINYLDPMLSITLPLPVKNVSNRDQEFHFLKKDFQGIKI